MINRTKIKIKTINYKNRIKYLTIIREDKYHNNRSISIILIISKVIIISLLIIRLLNTQYCLITRDTVYYQINTLNINILNHHQN